MELHLRPPLSISPRLLPGVRFDNFTVSLDPWNGWTYHIDFHGDADGVESITGEDFWPSLLLPEDDSAAVREAMGSLLNFVAHYADGVEFTGRTGRDADGTDLFPPRFAVWATHEAEAVALAGFDLENPDEE